MENRVREILERLESEVDRLSGELQELLPKPHVDENWEFWHYDIDLAAEQAAGAACSISDALGGLRLAE